MPYTLDASRPVSRRPHSWERSADGRTWTFHLRRGLRWSDGQPVTADDVIFTLDAIYDPRVTTRMRKFSQDGKTTPIRDVLDGDAFRQYDAVWHYIQTLPPKQAGKK